MTFTGVTLTDPVSGTSSVLMPRDGVTVMSLDVQPSVRAITEERVGASGQVDSTSYLSAAAVTLSLRLWDATSTSLNPDAFLDEINVLLSPALRTQLICSNDQWTAPRQLTCRFDSKSAVIDNPVTMDLSVSFKAPAGVWQAQSLTEASVPAFINSTGGLLVPSAGLAVPTTGLAVTASSTIGSPVAVAAGNMPVPWTARLYGPATGPKLANDTAGLTVEFADGLSIAAGDYVAVDSLARTALYNSDPSQSVLSYLSFATTTWWLMLPGTNQIRYHPTTASGGAVALVDFTAAWMS